MFNNLPKIKYLAYILGLATALVLVIPVNAETEKTQDSFWQDIKIDDQVDWQFSSEAESISLQDEIVELQDYSISELEIKPPRSKNINRQKWGNLGDVEDFALDAQVYEY